MEKVSIDKASYEGYAVLKGGEVIKLFNDNSDLVTDRDSNAFPVEVSIGGKKKTIDFIRRGRNCDLQRNLLKKIGENITVSANIDHKDKVVFGDGVLVYREKRDGTGKITREELMESDAPEIFEFMRLNDYNQIRMELANDLNIFGDAYIEYVFNRESKPKIAELRVRETTFSLISKVDEKTGKSEWHGYSDEWHKGTPQENIIVTPLLDRRASLRDLAQRIGKAPNKDGKQEAVKDRRFVHNLKVNTPGRFYYSHPYWWSVFLSGWYDFASAIPKYKRALMKNQVSLRYLVYIHADFWGKLYKAEKITDEKKQAERRSRFLSEMEEYLAGEENAGKTFVSEFRYDKIKGFEEKDIIIEQLENKKAGGEYIEDSEEATNNLCYAMNIHPSIIGASGKSKTINGTEARELSTIEQGSMKYIQDLTLLPLEVVKEINGWDKDIHFSVTNIQLTTLDKGTGAVKNTGIPKVTEEKQ